MAKRRYKKYRKYKKKGGDLETVIGVFVIVVVVGILNKFKGVNFDDVLKNIVPIMILASIIIILIVVLKKVYVTHKENEVFNRNFSLDELLSTYKSKPTDFEYYVANLYKKLGYKAKVTPPSNDGGKDIIMHKDGQKYVVEVKLYNHHNWITREQMQKLHSVAVDENANGIFVTTSSFKYTAVDWAKKCNINLVDGKKLVKMINFVK